MTIDEAKAQVIYELLAAKETTLTGAERIMATTISKSYGLPPVPVKVPDWLLPRVGHALQKGLEQIPPEEGAFKFHYLISVSEFDLREGHLDDERIEIEMREALDGKVHDWHITAESLPYCVLIKITATRGTL